MPPCPIDRGPHAARPAPVARERLASLPCAPDAPLRCPLALLRGLAAVACLLLAACGSEHAGKPEPPPMRVADRTVPGGDAARGRALLDRYQCGSCHTVPGAVTSGTPWAPPLTAWGGRSTLAGVLPNDPATLVRWLQDPPALVPGTRMPRLGVSEADARDLAAALMAMR